MSAADVGEAVADLVDEEPGAVFDPVLLIVAYNDIVYQAVADARSRVLQLFVRVFSCEFSNLLK